MIFSSVLSSASTYFHLPIDDPEDEQCDDGQCVPKRLTWVAPPSPSTPSTPSTPTSPPLVPPDAVKEVLSHEDLYKILGISKASSVDKVALRRAYLLRSKACHPDKFPDNPAATHAFQKVAVAYDILSQPALKRKYDSRPPSSQYDVFAARPSGHAEETFRSVILGIFNDFLDGDLEVIRTLLMALNNINPSLRIGEDGIDSVLGSLQSIRERALTCRTCIYTLHAELTRLIEVQHAFRQLSYFDLMGRSRLTIQLTRITLSLPFALEKALQEQNVDYGTERGGRSALLPHPAAFLIRSVDIALERMERVLK